MEAIFTYEGTVDVNRWAGPKVEHGIFSILRFEENHTRLVEA